MDNERYGRKQSDFLFLQRVAQDAQSKIDSYKEDCEADDCYSSDGMKEIILDWLDELEIYPDDIDSIIAKLEF